MKPLLDQGGVFCTLVVGKKSKFGQKLGNTCFPSHISTLLFFRKMTKVMVCDYSWI